MVKLLTDYLITLRSFKMTNRDAVFMSASVPTRDRKGYDSADSYLIREAVMALVEVILGRKLLVWGGQPAITPMIWRSANRYKIPYDKTVLLYQSKFFRDSYPEENTKFGNFVEVDAVDNDRDKSLRVMRETMFKDFDYSAAVFIGGMEGVVDEFELFSEFNPNATKIALPTPGGVSRELFERIPELPTELKYAIDYSNWFYELLKIKMGQERGPLN